MTEGEFQQHLQWLIDETRAAVAVYDCYEELQKVAREHREIELAMLTDSDRPFWLVQLGALQQTMFTILGRIFDNRKDSHSILKVLDAAEEHIGFFSHDALARRKSAAQQKPLWLHDYLKTAWAGDRQTLAEIKKSLKPHIELYREAYEPLRDKYFAHRSLKPQQTIPEMFQQTNREEIGKTIHYLRDVAVGLRQAFANGKRPLPVETCDKPDPERVRSAVRSVLSKLVERRLNA